MIGLARKFEPDSSFAQVSHLEIKLKRSKAENVAFRGRRQHQLPRCGNSTP